MTQVSVVLPTYNERETIVDVVSESIAALMAAGYDYEVLVVDDDSPDRTWELVEDHFADHLPVHVIRRTDDQGLSSAVLEGLERARGRFVVVMDADGQHPPSRVVDLLEALEGGAEVAIGSRHVDGGRIEAWSRRRSLMSSVATRIARLGVPPARAVADPMSGFFAVDRNVVDDRVLARADPHGYKILLELLALLDEPTVCEVPIVFRDRQGGSSSMTLDEQLRFLEHVATLGLLERGLGDRVVAPQLVRSVELGVGIGVALFLLFAGIWLGGVDGAGGAAMIAVAGGIFALATLRFARTGERWDQTDERYAKP